MLKIKDNVDLKELEKFGFKKGFDDYYTQDDRHSVIIQFNKENKIIRTRTTDYNFLQVRETWNIIYDLIKADMVVKVDD